MQKNFPASQRAIEKLKAARQLWQNVYIYGATGYGKTQLVAQFLGNRKYTLLSCMDSAWEIDRVEALSHQGHAIVVVDDLQLLHDERRQRAVLRLAEDPGVWLLLLCRSTPPAWLMPLYIKSGFLVISEDDLRLGKAEVRAYLAEHSISLPDDQLTYLCNGSLGNAYVIRFVTRRLMEGKKMDAALAEEATQALADYLENAVIQQWDSDLLEFLMQVSVVDGFDRSLAEFITGNHFAALLLDKAACAGNFLMKGEDGFQLRPVMLRALRHQAERRYGSERIKEYAHNAGLYYETHGKIIQALTMYEKSGSDDRIRELLVRNARSNPGNGHYFELRKYYLRLTPEEIEGSVILMAGISMLYSLLMQVDESEKWYERLKAYAETAKGGERREALSRIAYLDIALPHRGSLNLLDCIKRLPAMLLDQGIGLPEFSVTSNLPSTMNGGKDFCHWSPRDRELATTIGKPLERVLGRYGKGLVSVALAESQYEKGGDPYEVLSLLSQAQLQAESGGKLETAFAVVGIQVRINLLHGNAQAASELLDSFAAKALEQEANQLLPNLHALKCRVALYTNDYAAVNAWMEEAPDENRDFNLLERYRYLTKARCYLVQGEVMKAYALLQKLAYYAERYGRTYIRMEVGLLTAILHYRMGHASWKAELLTVLQEACAYGFLRLISEEGGAAAEMLEKAKRDCLACENIDRKWFLRLLAEAKKMAAQYPLYLQKQSMRSTDFSENALMVLRLQADGLSACKIAERLNVKVETVRYHAKQNYKKLGASGKTDAVLAARTLGIL